ncbi:hypothetical protein FBR02_20755 [Anaerolineae bacterium CFX9]|nr:hypothetical protein [Anaerolineae bacterium CFX9]
MLKNRSLFLCLTVVLVLCSGVGLAAAQTTCVDAAGAVIPCPPTPAPDSDGDGFPDNDDRCPFEAGIPGVGRGDCGDQDGDFITNDGDVCPNEPGPAELGGCPPTPVPTEVPPTATPVPPTPRPQPTAVPTAEPETACPVIPGYDSDGDCFSIGDLCPDVPGTFLGCPDRRSAQNSTSPLEAGRLLIALSNPDPVPNFGPIDLATVDDGTGTALLLPAVQSAREAVIQGPIVLCREDEELQMSICTGGWGEQFEPVFDLYLGEGDDNGDTEGKTYEDADWICYESEDLRESWCYPQFMNASYPPCEDCDPPRNPVAMEQVACNLQTSQCLLMVLAPPPVDECPDRTPEDRADTSDQAADPCAIPVAMILFDLPQEPATEESQIRPTHRPVLLLPALPALDDLAAVGDDGGTEGAGTGCWAGRGDVGCQVGFGGHFIAIYKNGNMVCYEDSLTGQHCVDL